MIHGHTHRPAIHNMTDGTKRIVLGDWDRCGWYLRQHEATFELERFAILDRLAYRCAAMKSESRVRIGNELCIQLTKAWQAVFTTGRV